MKQLPVVAFTAAMATWGLASIPADSVEKTSRTNGVRIAAAPIRGLIVGTSYGTFSRPRRKAVTSSLRMAGLSLDELWR